MAAPVQKAVQKLAAPKREERVLLALCEEGQKTRNWHWVKQGLFHGYIPSH